MSTEEDKPAERQWPVVVTLASPIDFAGKAIARLEFRRGKLGDLKGVALDAVPPVDKLLLIASRMCGEPVAALEMLGPDDGAEVIDIVAGFFAKCLQGGRNP